MKEIVKFGLVMGILFCAAVGVAIAQEEPSEDYKEGYKDGFYTGAMLLGQAISNADYLTMLYNDLGGNTTDVAFNETMTWSDYYNQQATLFNQETILGLNEFVLNVFGADDNRTEQLQLSEIPLIS
mgnify:CR=1 FL=1